MEKYVAASQWLAHHPKEAAPFEGQWIAVMDEKILGAAPTLKELLAQPAVKPHRTEALFTMVTTQDDAYLIPTNYSLPLA